MQLIAIFTVFCVTVAQAASFRLTPEEIAAENQYLASIGVDLKGKSFLLAEPFALPPTSPRAFLVPHSWYKKKAPDTVRSDDFLADLDALETVLRYQYSGGKSPNVADGIGKIG